MSIAAANIALIGFRATGKTTLGRMLADRLGWMFVDMDEELVSRFGMDIHNWVQEHGWDAFREAEAELLAELAGGTRQVVATGGGVVLRTENREQLRRHFQVVWLQASAETIHMRLAQDPKTASQRPPLTDLSLQEEISQLLAERTPLYEATCHFALMTDAEEAETLVNAIIVRR